MKPRCEQCVNAMMDTKTDRLALQNKYCFSEKLKWTSEYKAGNNNNKKNIPEQHKLHTSRP